MGGLGVIWEIIQAYTASLAKKFEESIKLRDEEHSKRVDRATGGSAPIRDFPDKAPSPLQIRADAIIEQLQTQLAKVPDFASSLKFPSRNFGPLIDNATGQRDSEFFHAVKISPTAFEFANLLIVAYHNVGYHQGYVVSSTIGEPGEHGSTSFHYDGRAIDVRTNGLSKQEIKQIRELFASLGVRCYDETVKENWTEHTTGYHLHFDTATRSEVIQRMQIKRFGGTRLDLGIGDGWPPRR
jgi:hypothetical protein